MSTCGQSLDVARDGRLNLTFAATIMDFDVILVMDEGVVVESGTPQELLTQPSSRFASLAASQGLA